MLFFSTALLIVAIDQFSKNWIRSNLALGQSLLEVGIFRLTHIRNTGAAFGLFPDQTSLLTLIALVGIAALLVYALFICRHYHFSNCKLDKVALGLILGGTVGNFIDRIRLGYVTDFINFNHWPAFNIADSAVTIGVILFAYSLLSTASSKKH